MLREKTAGAHAAVDTAAGGFDDLPSYRAYLRAIAAFRAPIEQQLDGLHWPETLGVWRPRSIGAAIAADMRDLDVTPVAAQSAKLRLDGAGLYGTLYVLEGSALGARLLFRRAQDLGLSAGYGARHLALLGGSIDGWRGFLDLLEQADPFDLDLAVEASSATFALARAAFEAR